METEWYAEKGEEMKIITDQYCNECGVKVTYVIGFDIGSYNSIYKICEKCVKEAAYHMEQHSLLMKDKPEIMEKDEWTETMRIEDIPKDDWNNYYWEYWVSSMSSGNWSRRKNPPALIEVRYNPDGTIIVDEFRYKKKEMPTDEYIEAHLWEITEDIFVPMIKAKPATSDTIKQGWWHSMAMESGIFSREWFLTARRSPKSAIKEYSK